MGVYYDPDLPPVVPDGFLSLNVRRIVNENLRLSYLLWEEKVLPTMVLEVVSKKRRGEYKKKKDFYAELGILYYVIYNPIRPSKPPLDVYRLVNGEYVAQKGNPVWLEEVGLAIGYERGTHLGITRDWLYWYDQQGVRYLTPEELASTAEQRASTAEQRASTAEQRAKRLAEELRSLGIDPDTLN